MILNLQEIMISVNEEASKRKPYVGSRPYEEADRAIFFGRDRESDDLLSLLYAHRAVLLYAQSGAGKSSLVNAGVTPLLRGEGFDVLPMANVRGPDLLPVSRHDIRNPFVFAVLLGWLSEAADPHTIAQAHVAGFLEQPLYWFSFRHPSTADMDAALDMDGLREHLQAHGIALSELARAEPIRPGKEWAVVDNKNRFSVVHEDDHFSVYRPWTLYDADGQEMRRILIFDQFEEIFTAYQDRWQDRDGFFADIEELLEQDPALGLLFVIREDYLAQLDPYLIYLPEQLGMRYRLECLEPEAAKAAIQGPLSRVDVRRRYGDGVVDTLIQNLLKIKVVTETGTVKYVEGPYVEPVQLSVVCENLWKNLASDDHEIGFEHLKEFGNVDTVLSTYYDDAVREAVGRTGGHYSERRLRNWFENRLITAARTRGMVYWGNPDDQDLPPQEIIHYLGNVQHIIRGEWRAGAHWLELTHDRFVDPILESNRRWRTEHESVLTTAAADWERLGRDASALLRGPRLAEAEAWARTHSEALEPSELEYLHASRDHARQRRIYEQLAAGMALFLIIAAVAGGIAFHNGRRAQAEAAQAFVQRAVADINMRQPQKGVYWLDQALETDPALNAEVNHLYRKIEDQTGAGLPSNPLNSEDCAQDPAVPISPACRDAVASALAKDDPDVALAVCSASDLAERSGADLIAAACARTGELATPTSYGQVVEGRLADIDHSEFWRFAGSPGDVVHIEANHAEESRFLDPILSLYTPAGSVLTFAALSDDAPDGSSLDASLTYTVTDTGWHVVIVEAYNSWGEYQLSFNRVDE